MAHNYSEREDYCAEERYQIDGERELYLDATEILEDEEDAFTKDEKLEDEELLSTRDSGELYEDDIQLEIGELGSTFDIEIGGENRNIGFEPEQVAAAYDKALSADDVEACKRLSVIYDLSCFKDELELGDGDAEVPQLAGEYSVIRKIEPEGFEAHHMPAKSAVYDNMNELPAVAMEASDHAQTDSYRGRANHVFKSFIPGLQLSDSYKYETAKEINEGRYVHVVKCEIYNIKDRCGSKYDGAIGKFLDASMKYVAKNGVPNGIQR